MPTTPTATATVNDPATEPQRFMQLLQASLADDGFVKLQLAKPSQAAGAPATLDKLLVRRLLLRGAPHLSLLWRHHTQDITKNLPQDQALAQLATLLGAPFGHAHLVTRTQDVQLALGRKMCWRLQVGKLAPVGAEQSSTHTSADNHANSGPAAHDRAKQHALALDTPFLAELGVADAQGRLVPAMARKWRQINKFAEVLAAAIAQSPLAGRDPTQPVRVLDFGAGKGYLTFAVHHQLLAMGRLPQVTGVELREPLTTLCNQAVAKLGLQGLRFVPGDMAHFGDDPQAPADQADAARHTDIMIALHACDTATDLAMHQGVQRGAAIILCSPCCHKELRPQMQAPALLQPMLRHGIHMAEQAEMLTDALRALLLQTAGYDSQVFEFISPEHTGKNRMVLAVRRNQPPSHTQVAAWWAQVAALKAHFGVQRQTLESLLQGAPGGSAAAAVPA